MLLLCFFGTVNKPVVGLRWYRWSTQIGEAWALTCDHTAESRRCSCLQITAQINIPIYSGISCTCMTFYAVTGMGQCESALRGRVALIAKTMMYLQVCWPNEGLKNSSGVCVRVGGGEVFPNIFTCQQTAHQAMADVFVLFFVVRQSTKRWCHN